MEPKFPLVTINLQPWREARRARLQKRFQRNLALSAAVGIAAVALMWMGLSTTLSGQDKRNAFLEKHIAEAKAEITEIEDIEQQRERLLNRQKVIEDLQSNRTMMAHLLYDIASLTVDGVLLEGLKHQKDMLEIQGRARSNSTVSGYLTSLDRSEWMGTPELVVVAGRESGTSPPTNTSDAETLKQYPFAFSIKVKVANPYAKAKAEAEEAAEEKSKKKGKKPKKKD